VNTSQASQSGWQIGFVHRENNAIITQFLAEYAYLIPGGYPVTLFSQGDFWAKFLSGAVPGQSVYADSVTGAPIAAAAGVAGAQAFTGAIAGTTLTVSAATGLVLPGASVAGTGVAAGTVILKQLTGTANGAGTYQVSVSQTVASEALTSTLVATPWLANSKAAAGELAKISTW
jgi:hypothetical protein